mgnify:CR=1 FL=1
MLELLVFGAIAAIVATLFWGKKLIPPSGITGKIPAWGGRIAGSATVALVAAAIWWLIPWGLSPPAKMLTSFMSKEAYETLSWSLGVGLIALTSWLVWVIWGSSPVSTKKEPLSGVWLVWILAIVAAAVTTYAIADRIISLASERTSETGKSAGRKMMVDLRRLAYGDSETVLVGENDVAIVQMAYTLVGSGFVNFVCIGTPVGIKLANLYGSGTGAIGYALDQASIEKLAGTKASVSFILTKKPENGPADCTNIYP